AVRDELIGRWLQTRDAYDRSDAKRVCYLSVEFLLGRLLGNYLINLGIFDDCAVAMRALGYRLEDLRETEFDAGLGNGGLGRLAATAFATSTGFFFSTSATAPRSKPPTTGCATETSGRFRGPIGSI